MDVNQTYDLKKAFVGIMANLPAGVVIIWVICSTIFEGKPLIFLVSVFFAEFLFCSILASLSYELSVRHKDFFVFLSFLVSISMLYLYEIIIKFRYYLAEPWNVISIIGEVSGGALFLWFLWSIIYSFLIRRLK